MDRDGDDRFATFAVRARVHITAQPCLAVLEFQCYKYESSLWGMDQWLQPPRQLLMRCAKGTRFLSRLSIAIKCVLVCVEMMFSLSPFVNYSLEAVSVVPSRVSPLILHTSRPNLRLLSAISFLSNSTTI